MENIYTNGLCLTFNKHAIKKIIGLFTFLLIIIQLSAQQRTAVISFSEKTFDYGTIKESDGPVTHVFNFTNAGTVPLIVQDASPSCGCTTPDWTKQPIMPGAKGYIKAIFDPAGRPGKFDKEITVVSNASTPSVVLKITGTVIAKAPLVQEEYRFALGDVRAKSSYIFFGKVSPVSKKDTTIEVINTGKAPVEIKFVTLPAMIKAEAKPAILAPGAKGKLQISYDATKKKDWGFLVDKIKLSVGNKIDPAYQLTVAIDIQEDFSKLTPAQLTNAPILKFDEVSKDLGTLKQGEVKEVEFAYKNAGKSDLIFRKFESSCGCTSVSSKGMTIKPGESGVLKVKFNSAGKKSRQNLTVTAVSNDPRSSRVMLKLTGVVE